jgi:CysZ protein
MDFVSGFLYNLKGLKLGMKSPKLLGLGLIRFLLFGILAIIFSILVYQSYQDIFTLLWTRPESLWFIWLWHLSSWFIGLLMLAMAVAGSYLVGQLIFSVYIMDLMAQITEKMMTGKITKPVHSSVFRQMFFLIRQEIPRAVIPVMLTTLLMILGWVTPLGPVLAFISPAIITIFLAWDNTDLIPARKLVAFKERWRFLMRHLPFHLGFGILFLIPFANILFLSFAPVGATLFLIDRQEI